MRIPRVRFTVRRMMVAVVIAAIPLAITGDLFRRSVAYRRVAALHETAAVECGMALKGARGTDIGRLLPGRISWHARMYAKYHEAARRPWLRVEPDPPEPK
jgi:hypothetical protein